MTSAWLATTMRAGRVYAFAAAVGEPVDAPESDELGEPTRKVPGDQVSGVAASDPAGDQPQLRQRFSRPHQRRADRLLIVQQAEEIFAPLADDNAALFQRGIGVEPIELVGDLALQVAGVCRDPY